MTFRTLILATELHRLMQSPQADLVVFDVSFDLTNAAAGHRAHLASHLPGARYLHLDRDLAGHRRVAGMAAFDFTLVAGAAVRAYENVFGGEFGPISSPNLGWQFSLHHPVGPALMVNQAAWPELRDGQESSSLKKRPRLSLTGHERIERQTREVVAGKKPFGCEIAV
jgi:hypothetical protein